MLYDDDRKSLQKIEQPKRNFIKNKFLVCGIIIFCCVCIIGVNVWKSNQNTSQNEVAISENNNSVKHEEKHMQIEKHDINQIKSSFLPQKNENAQQEITNIYYSEEKVAYLTFDDGPSKNITPQILDILKEQGVPATFFVLGSRVELYPDLVKREFDEGHYIANHGYSHQYSQIYVSKDTVFGEYADCENAIKNALGNQDYNSYLFRFPGGSSGGRYASIKAEAKQLLNSYGISNTNWNCLTGDAEGNTTTEALMSRFIETMQGDGSLIVLMHDASDKSYTAETLPQIIAYLKEQGYVFKNFYEIFKKGDV